MITRTHLLRPVVQAMRTVSVMSGNSGASVERTGWCLQEQCPSCKLMQVASIGHTVSRLEMSHALPPGDPRAAKKRRKDSTPGPEARPITSFFTGGPKQAQASSEAVLQPTAT
jgi:hypothetical protein